MLITVLLPGIIKMTLEQHQPVVPAVCAASFSPPSSCSALTLPQGSLHSPHSSHALGPSAFLKGLLHHSLRIFKLFNSILHGIVRVNWGCCEEQIWVMWGSDLLPLCSCSGHQGTQLYSAGNLLRQCVQATSPFLSLHLVKWLIFTPCFAFFCVFETSVDDCGGDGITAI